MEIKSGINILKIHYTPDNTFNSKVFHFKKLFKEEKDHNVAFSPVLVKLELTLFAEAAGQSVTSKTRTVGKLAVPQN